MADRKIAGITVEIGGDTKKLNDALKGTNKKIKDTQAQLKDVEKLLRLDPTNTELLRQRQSLLAKAVGETKEKLDTLKAAEKEAQTQFKEGKISEEQYNALKREIIETESNLKSLEKSAKTSNAALEKVRTTTEKWAKTADTVAKNTRAISGAAAGFLGSMGALALKTAATADDINTMSRNSGFSTETVQEWMYAADRIDVSVDSIGKAGQKLTKAMKSTSEDTQAAFKRLGVSATDAEGAMRPVEDVFWDVVAALGQVENETERDQLAMQLLGGSAADLSGIIDDGGEAFHELAQEAKDLGLIMDQDALDSANELNAGIDKLKSTMAGAFSKVGAEIAEDLLPTMETLLGWVEQAVHWLGTLDGEQLKTIAIILAVVAAISPLASAISGILTLIGAVSTALEFLIANPIVAAIAAIIALVAVIATQGDKIQEILGKVDDFLQNIFARDFTEIFGPVLGTVINTFMVTVKNWWDSLKMIFDGIIDFIRGVFTGDWKRAWQGVVEIFTGIFERITQAAKIPINAVIAIINTALNHINGMIENINKIPGVNIGTIGKIPYMAEGGELIRGKAIVGEAGPELLTVDGGRTIVQPLTAAGPTYQNSQTFGNFYVTVNAGATDSPDSLADTIAERLQELIERRE